MLCTYGKRKRLSRAYKSLWNLIPCFLKFWCIFSSLFFEIPFAFSNVSYYCQKIQEKPWQGANIKTQKIWKIFTFLWGLKIGHVLKIVKFLQSQYVVKVVPLCKNGSIKMKWLSQLHTTHRFPEQKIATRSLRIAPNFQYCERLQLFPRP